MKNLMFFIGLSIFIIACNNNPQNTGYSTPIDSSNTSGKAGATYGPDNPAATQAPRYEGNTDSGLRANTMSHDDSVKAGYKK
jgi:hypothetical protein